MVIAEASGRGPLQGRTTPGHSQEDEWARRPPDLCDPPGRGPSAPLEESTLPVQPDKGRLRPQLRIQTPDPVSSVLLVLGFGGPCCGVPACPGIGNSTGPGAGAEAPRLVENLGDKGHPPSKRRKLRRGPDQPVTLHVRKQRRRSAGQPHASNQRSSRDGWCLGTPVLLAPSWR